MKRCGLLVVGTGDAPVRFVPHPDLDEHTVVVVDGDGRAKAAFRWVDGVGWLSARSVNMPPGPDTTYSLSVEYVDDEDGPAR